MIDIHCPACHVDGRVPNDKVNTRLVCRKCLKTFHVTPAGRAVPGAPPQTSEAATNPALNTSVPDRAQEVDQWFERISRACFSPRTALILGGLIVLVIGSTMYPRGETLEDRVRKVARAAYDGDTAALRSLAVGGTSDEVSRWHGAIQASLGQLRESLGGVPPTIHVEIHRLDPSDGTAEVVARMSAEQGLTRRGTHLPDPTIVNAAGVKFLELPLRFRIETWKGWRLDGKQTLDVVPRA